MSSSSCSTELSIQKPHGYVTTQCIAGWRGRPLPDVSIPLNSDQGKLLFREALLTDGLHGYFSLAEKFHTQSEPSYCGPGTLTMVLNSLNIDPGSIWKGNWRFFDESMLRTCDKRKPTNDPLEKIIDEGMTFEEFLYMAECNGASVIPYLASHSTLAQFQSAILAACTRRFDDLRLICSYNRSTLRQTGTGHFSPIAGYHADKDLVLILDVARFKYPPHWVPIELLWQSMCTIDVSTGKSRGFYLIARCPNDNSISCQANSCQTAESTIPVNIQSLCSVNESLNDFIDQDLNTAIDQQNQIETLIRDILTRLTPVVVQQTTKWTFDLMQKYRIEAVSAGMCSEQCECPNPFGSYSTFLPEIINSTEEKSINECKRPCERVTRSHLHVHAVPTQCAVQSFIDLFDEQNNRSLYEILEKMKVENNLTINIAGKSMYLFGGISSIVDDDDRTTTTKLERGLTAIFLYAIRSDRFLSKIDIFNWSDVTSALKEQIFHAKKCFGIFQSTDQ